MAAFWGGPGVPESLDLRPKCEGKKVTQNIFPTKRLVKTGDLVW